MFNNKDNDVLICLGGGMRDPIYMLGGRGGGVRIHIHEDGLP